MSPSAPPASAPASSSPARLRLAYAGLRIDATSADPAVLSWLREFLGPAFDSPADGEADHEAHFRVAPDAHAALHAELEAAPPQLVEAFTLDGSFSRHPAFARGAQRWIHDPSHDVFFGISAAARRVEVVARDADPYHRLALMRVVRELATLAAHRQRWLPVHAAAFVLDGAAVLVCGRKRAGKTSVLVHALQRGARFLSNDRVMVSPGAPPRARAMPTIAMLRNGTLALFAGLRADFERTRPDRARTLAECAPGVARPLPRAGAGFDQPGMSPAQLCHLLGARMQGEAPLRALLFPGVDPAARGLRLEALAREAADARLAESLLKPSHPTRPSEAFATAADETVAPAEEEDRRRRLAAAVPAFALRLGPDAYEADLLEALRRAFRDGAAQRSASASSRNPSSA